jgi:DNA-binding response OmpR family regulator
MKKGTIFIVEDDLVSAQYLKEILEVEGFEILGIADNGQDVLDRLRNCPVDIVLMDIILKGAMTGSEAALKLKQMHPSCKIIFLTAYADEEMIEYALDAKAAAYLLKPYREKEIIATIQMVLKQDQPKEPPNITIIQLKSGFIYDMEKHTLSKEGRAIPLSDKKRKLIEILAKNKNRVVSNEELYMYIWQEPKNNGSLRSLISRFKDQVGTEIITNVNSLGYIVTS